MLRVIGGEDLRRKAFISIFGDLVATKFPRLAGIFVEGVGKGGSWRHCGSVLPTELDGTAEALRSAVLLYRPNDTREGETASPTARETGRGFPVPGRGSRDGRTSVPPPDSKASQVCFIARDLLDRIARVSDPRSPPSDSDDDDDGRGFLLSFPPFVLRLR